MNILLINPPCRRPTLVPVGLGYIASVLRNEGHNILLEDLNARPRTPSEIEKDLKSLEFDLIGIGGLTTTYKFVKKLSSLVKRIKPKAKIIAGNMVSTATPELLLKNSDVDICVIDEGEETVKELVHKISDYPNMGDIKGIAFKDGTHIVVTGNRKRVEDLDKLPYPAWDLFPMETYINNLESGKRAANISTVRGCPFQCIYCSRPFGSHVSMRSPGSVIAEIGELKRRYRIEHVTFADDLFMVKKAWVEELCGMLIKENLDITWGTSARVNLVDLNLLKKMKNAGCIWLSYGFESGSQRILDMMKKGVKVEQAEFAVKITRNAGIRVNGSFMIGMIGETEETIDETVDFIRRTGLPLSKLFYTTPYPDTPLYEMAKIMNRLPPDEDAYVSSLGEMHDTFLVNLTDMTDEELKNLKEKAESAIEKNFSFRAKLDVLDDDIKRVYSDFRLRLNREGVLPALKWCVQKIGDKFNN